MGWVCRACTFDNSNDTFLACAICGEERGIDEFPLINRPTRPPPSVDSFSKPGRPPPSVPAGNVVTNNNNNNNKTPTQNKTAMSGLSEKTPKNSPMQVEKNGKEQIAGIIINKEEKNDLKPLYMELIETERQYVMELELIVTRFLQPLMIKAQEPNEKLSFGIQPRDVVTIFSNIKELLHVNIELLREMEKAIIQPTEEKIMQGLCQAFLTMVPHLKMYSIYAINYEKGQQLLRRLQKENVRFDKYLEQVSVTHCPPPHLQLSSYLIKPVQRICKYPLFFKAMLKTDVVAGVDDVKKKSGWVQTLEKAYDASIKSTENVNSEKQRAEDSLRAFDIALKLEGLGDVVLDPSRRYVGEWRSYLTVGDSNVSKKKKSAKQLILKHSEIEKKARCFFVFSDGLMIVKEVGTGMKSKYLFRLWFSLDQLQVIGNSNNSFIAPSTPSAGDGEADVKSKFVLPLEILHLASTDIAKNQDLKDKSQSKIPSSSTQTQAVSRRGSFIASTLREGGSSSNGGLVVSGSTIQLPKPSTVIITSYTFWFRSVAEKERVEGMLSKAIQTHAKANDEKQAAVQALRTSSIPKANSFNGGAKQQPNEFVLDDLKFNNLMPFQAIGSDNKNAAPPSPVAVERKQQREYSEEEILQMSIRELKSLIQSRSNETFDLFEKQDLIQRAFQVCNITPTMNTTSKKGNRSSSNKPRPRPPPPPPPNLIQRNSIVTTPSSSSLNRQDSNKSATDDGGDDDDRLISKWFGE